MSDNLNEFKNEVNKRFDKFEDRQDEFQKTSLEIFGQLNGSLHKISEVLVKQEMQERINEDQQQQINKNTENCADLNLRLTTAVAVDSEREKRFDDKLNRFDSTAKGFVGGAFKILSAILTVAIMGGLAFKLTGGS